MGLVLKVVRKEKLSVYGGTIFWRVLGIPNLESHTKSDHLSLEESQLIRLTTAHRVPLLL